MKKSISYSIFTLLLAIVVTLLPGSLALAAIYNGYYWEQGPVDLLFLISDSVSDESWTGWYNAHEVWNEADDSPTEFEYTENDLIEIIYCDYGYDAQGNWDGITSYVGYPTITYATVTMNEYKTDTYAYSERVSVGAHEFGHVLGLGDHSGDYIMEHYTTIRWGTYTRYEPSEDDIEYVIDLYD